MVEHYDGIEVAGDVADKLSFRDVDLRERAGNINASHVGGARKPPADRKFLGEAGGQRVFAIIAEWRISFVAKFKPGVWPATRLFQASQRGVHLRTSGLEIVILFNRDPQRLVRASIRRSGGADQEKSTDKRRRWKHRRSAAMDRADRSEMTSSYSFHQADYFWRKGAASERKSSQRYQIWVVGGACDENATKRLARLPAGSKVADRVGQ